MRRNLHLLHALRFFECAARHLSFTRAAQELCVTQAAVSHQVRILETALNRPLFERASRSVRLTADGMKLSHAMHQSFGSIEAAVDDVLNPKRVSLGLSVTPTFSSRWLIPRLSGFWDANPDIDLRLHHQLHADAHNFPDLDASIVWAARPPQGMWSRHLFGTALAPVCSPQLAKSGAQLDSPVAALAYPLLHEDNHDDWIRWFRLSSIESTRIRAGQIIDDTNALLVAAMAGRGLALGRVALIEHDIVSGLLVKPFELEIPANGSYWLTANPSIVTSGKFKAFNLFLDNAIPADEGLSPIL